MLLVILQYCSKFWLSEAQVHGRALFPALYIVDARAWWLLVLLKLPFLGLMFSLLSCEECSPSGYHG